jgi:Xaa-Pro aminopeptidase
VAIETGLADEAVADERKARLASLRAELSARGLAGFVVPRADEHQGEYVAARAERLAWLTGFTGSAGLAVVLRDKAAIFVDGRYTLQVRDQVDTGLFEPLHLIENPADQWLAAHLRPGDKFGYDPWLHTADGVARLRAASERAGAELAALADNPVDAVWPDQPDPPLEPAVPHELRFAGKPSSDKRRELAAELTGEGVDAAVLTAPDSIAWLLNFRGGDLPFTPVALCFAALFADGRVDLFIDRRKVGADLEAHLGDGVELREPGELGPALDGLGEKKARVRADPATAAAWVFDRLRAAGAVVVQGADPCALPKACKNPVELRGAFAAHLRDGSALTRFLAWLAREAPKGTVTELTAAQGLEAFRREMAMFQGLSFPTISGSGPHGAIVHYRYTEETDRALVPGEVYLIDSGAQYLDGTTDVTRTVFIAGDRGPSAEQRDRFTRVLKGHIAIATARFPKGTSGRQLDSLARTALWEAGLDFDHGTGHGVGSYLGVHEGPQRMAKIGTDVALQPGMIVSNEPGYYKADGFGIRIENLVTVVAVEAPEGAEHEMLGFETLTLAPIDRTLVEPGLMSTQETAWLDSYHARVRDSLGTLVDPETAAWLNEATRPLGE